MEKAEKVALILAILLLSVGFASSVYLKKLEEKSEEILEGDYIKVNDDNISLNEIFNTCSQKTVTTDKGNFTGTPLSCIINLSNVADPEDHEYAIIGADGYQQTVSWDDMKKGILTEERNTIFPHLPRKFWVKDVVEIEVK